MEGPVRTKKSKKVFPRLTLRHEFFPIAKKWEVGKTYEVRMRLKMTGLSISRFSNDSEFDIIGFGADGVKGGSDHNSDHGDEE